jgi:hypothetical protein
VSSSSSSPPPPPPQSSSPPWHSPPWWKRPGVGVGVGCGGAAEVGTLEQLLRGPNRGASAAQGTLLRYLPDLRAAGFTASSLAAAASVAEGPEASRLAEVIRLPFHLQRLRKWVRIDDDLSAGDVAVGVGHLRPTEPVPPVQMTTANAKSSSSVGGGGGGGGSAGGGSGVDSAPTPSGTPPSDHDAPRPTPERSNTALAGLQRGTEAIEDFLTPGAEALECEEALVERLMQSGMGFDRGACEAAVAKVRPPRRGDYEMAVELLVGGAV